MSNIRSASSGLLPYLIAALMVSIMLAVVSTMPTLSTSAAVGAMAVLLVVLIGAGLAMLRLRVPSELDYSDDQPNAGSSKLGARRG
jgi:hypothetical protein